MSDGTVPRGSGNPYFDGAYVVETVTGWRVLEFHNGEGWGFPERTARWGADAPAQWVGPLPKHKYAEKPKLPEFDL